MRMAAFEHVRRLGEVHDHLTAKDSKPGIIIDGDRIPLINPQRGFCKPQQMRFHLRSRQCSRSRAVGAGSSTSAACTVHD
jgi:hypothetical protein